MKIDNLRIQIFTGISRGYHGGQSDNNCSRVTFKAKMKVGYS